MPKKSRTYEIKFRDLNGENKSFFVSAKTPEQAAKRKKSKGKILSVSKAYI